MNDAPILLVDSFAQIYRGFHAVRFLSTSDGVPTNAVFAMAKFLLKLHREFPSRNGAFVFDKGRPAFRMELAPDYKANRPPMPEELRSQIPLIRELVEAFGWNIIEHDGYEADDLIASVALAFPDYPVRIFSGDKDISQIIDDRIEMLVPDPAGSVAKRGAGEVLEKFGVPPSGIVDYLALIGDASDNIPGIAGIGPKTASTLLQQFGSGENLFAHLDEIPRETLRQKLEGAKEQFEKNVKLVKLDTAPPDQSAWSMEQLTRREPDFAKLRELAERLQLKSILKEINTLAPPPVSDDDLFAVPEPIPEKTPEIKTAPPANTGNMTQMDLF